MSTKWKLLSPPAPPISPPASSALPTPPPTRLPLLLFDRKQMLLPRKLSPSIPSHRHSASGETRRDMLCLLASVGFLIPVASAVGDEGIREDLEWYADEAEGFALLKPSSWLKVEKAGATVLFEEGKGKPNNIGIVVNPVRLNTLRDFGTPQFVADKLIQAERKKESTKDVQLITATERLGRDGLPVYELEYMVDSTRGGLKRIFSAAFVSSRKLYLLNISYADRLDSPLGGETKMVLEEILHSFDAAT